MMITKGSVREGEEPVEVLVRNDFNNSFSLYLFSPTFQRRMATTSLSPAQPAQQVPTFSRLTCCFVPPPPLQSPLFERGSHAPTLQVLDAPGRRRPVQRGALQVLLVVFLVLVFLL